MPFKLNYGYHSYVFYKNNINLYFGFKVANELTEELKNLMTVYRKNLQHA